MKKGRFIKICILLFIDILSINFAYLGSFIVRHGIIDGFEIYKDNLRIMPLFTLAYVIPLYIFNMYKSVWRIAGIDEGIKVLFCSLIGTVLASILSGLSIHLDLPIILMTGFIIFVLAVGARMSLRVIRRILVYGDIKGNDRTERVMIIGAGACGSIVIEEMFKNKESNMKPICIIDDNPTKFGKFIKGIKVEGNRFDIERIVKKDRIDTIIMAIASINSEEKRKILESCQETKAKLRIVPGISEILEDKVQATQMREVDIKDLLGREEVKLDKEGIKGYIKNKTVLVTGGGGSIGSELCRQIAKHSPKRLIILDIYENNAYDIQNELKRNYSDLDLRTIIASVRDKDRLNKIFEEENINVVFHAAAHKHVPLMENNSEEAIKNNVMGTLNVAECTNEYNVERFVLISTDKAVNPTNIMGATKRLCEMIIQGIDKKSKTEFVAVRFGNVLGSNGSVIPLFKKQIAEGGPVTLTHKEITRYFMLIPEAAQLVL
ncbi:nucleoside-diphosphate sugar epimerase/dehydratase, partial [Clostridium thermobutyricum]|uniref:nucleoside-diphosphate sugar epimerase/dehydratase n=1 Tax=Clostridium thermobutyricum TaxID=29372 RepID=UPI0018AA1013